ncbi:H-type small acid-soluble spore protein [Paenibacillus hamazuiensis]|uniref:H-type small acid-soluble spore protein n=1 Tax=Paenibacillus hamazuiensis TaxID=2936508 RepID=UPI00200D20C2|nr:H-type small acid-soluble spore protein [Paenibacillus hamazuiensis]
MQANRVQEILQSDKKIDVQWNGMSVWIDSVDTQNQTAKVHAESNPADTRVVSVTELQEVQ